MKIFLFIFFTLRWKQATIILTILHINMKNKENILTILKSNCDKQTIDISVFLHTNRLQLYLYLVLFIVFL